MSYLLLVVQNVADFVILITSGSLPILFRNFELVALSIRDVNPAKTPHIKRSDFRYVYFLRCPRVRTVENEYRNDSTRT